MGFSNWFRKRGSASGPDDLLTALLTGFERQDFGGLMSLINNNSEAIRSQFPSWLKPPAALREDPAGLQRYVNTLMAIARLFEKAGDPSLFELLTGKGGDNPIVRWQKDCDRADQLTDSGRPAEAVALLRATLDSMSGLSGPGVDHWRPRALGRLGAALSKDGQTTDAIRATREALELCRLAGDDEGVRVYTANLDQIGTYEVADESTEGGRALVVFIDEQGQTLAPEELSKALDRGRVRWEIRGGHIPRPEAKRLHTEGRTAGERDDYAAAISLFTQAAELDPMWAYPVYDRAFTHLLMQDFAAALADYRRTLELAPAGFFAAAQAADMLTREAAGEFPAGLYASFAMLPQMPREEQQSVLEQLVKLFPSHAPAWDAHADFIEDQVARLAAVDQGLGACPDSYTLGSLLVRKAFALDALGRTKEALEILIPLTTSPGELLSTHASASLALARIRGRQGE